MNIDWYTIFMPDTPIPEIIVRGSVMYLALFVLLRVVLKRQAGSLGITDLLLITILADASQNGLAGSYTSIGDGIILVTTILGWTYALDWLSFHSSLMQRLIEPPPVPLIANGKTLYRNMRKELITQAELMEQLREQGIDQIEQVKSAIMESDGKISIIPSEKSS